MSKISVKSGKSQGVQSAILWVQRQYCMFPNRLMFFCFLDFEKESQFAKTLPEPIKTHISIIYIYILIYIDIYIYIYLYTYMYFCHNDGTKDGRLQMHNFR